MNHMRVMRATNGYIIEPTGGYHEGASGIDKMVLVEDEKTEQLTIVKLAGAIARASKENK